MLRRFARSLVVFVALVAAYQAYVLLAVPFMEPPLAVREARQATRDELDRAARSITQYQLLLSNYFPRDHWSQLRPPKVIASSNEQAMLVLDDYVQREGGQVDIDRFALLVFPTPPREGVTPPHDAIILESSQGAKLQFDDFRPERGQIGQITRGQFPGRITIRSDMHEPGPEDDLLIETSNLEMNTKLLYTHSPVRFRMGPNIGGGRELEIRLLADEHSKPNDPGLKIAGIDALEIRRDVRMRLQLETQSLLPGRDNEKDIKTAEPASGLPPQAKENAPVEVTCSGPFTFDFVRYVASLDRDVELRQLNPDGPSDQLVCKQLDIHFTPKALVGASTTTVVDPGDRQHNELGRLQATAIVAEGHPVVVTSPAREAQARGDRIQIALRDMRVRVSGPNAMFMYGPNVLRAPAIDYQHPESGSGMTVGQFRASGPGSLHYVLDAAKPEQFFQAVWQTSVALGRDKGQPVLTLEGRPQFGLANAGSLTADRIQVYLRELEGSAANVGLPIAGSSGGESKTQIAPDRLAAVGRVEIQSPQLTGRTSELLATFRIKQPSDSTSENEGGSFADRLNLVSPAGQPQPGYYIESDTMQLEIHAFANQAQPQTLDCNGNVLFREVPLAVASEQPLEIRGARLTVDRLASGTPYVTLRGSTVGARGTQSGGVQAAPVSVGGGLPAQLAGRGIAVLADTVEFDAKDNRMWSDGRGKATLLVTRDLDGRTAAQPFPLEITWHGGLSFDGRTIFFDRHVLVASADNTLRCDRLAAKLTAPIQFGQGINQQAIDLLEVQCQGQVKIEHYSRDATGIISHERMQLAGLTINQQTGAVSGAGPGELRSTHFGQSLAALGAGQPGGQSAIPLGSANSTGSKLNFLRVDFRRGLSGQLYTRELTFHEQVRTVYGPVDAWEQEFDPLRPELLPSDAMTLSCEEMRINEDPVAARLAAANGAGETRPFGKVQLTATGNVQINGQTPSHGAFSAQAGRASYEQLKEVFILEGDGRTPATLWRAGQTGSPPAARKIIYNRLTGNIMVDGIQYFEFSPEDIQNARQSKPVR